jgi:glycosyltransferase involved in cell wall biosynthesis/O-antigen ligase
MSIRSEELPGRTGDLVLRLRKAEFLLVPMTTAALVLGTSQFRRHAPDLVFWGKFAVMGILGVVACLILFLEGNRPRATAFEAGFAVLVLLAFASTLYSVARTTTLKHSISLLILAVSVLAVPLTWRTRDEVIQGLRSVALVAAATVVVGLVLAPTNVITAFHHHRFLGVFENPNALGYMVAPILPAVIIAGVRAVPGGDRRLALAIGGIIAVGLLLSGSRAGILASLAGIAVGGLMLGGQTRRILVAVAAVAVVGGLLEFVPNSPFRHIVGYGQGVDLMSGGGRTEAWAAAIRLTDERPIQGHGFGTTETFFLARNPELRLKYSVTYGAPHNSYLETALELGWPGAALLVLLVGSGILAAVRVVRRRDGWQPLGAVALAGIVGGTVEGFFESSVLAVGGLLAFHFWLVASLIHAIRSKDEEIEVPPMVAGGAGPIAGGPAESLRILFVARAYYPATRYGGPVTSLRRTCETLVARGHRVTVYCSNMAGPGRSGKQLPAGRFLIDGVRVRFLRTPIRFHWEGIGWSGVAELRKEVAASDLIHVSGTRHYLGVVAERTARRRGVPYVVAPDGSLPPRSRTIAGKRALDAMYTRRSLSRAARVLAASEAEARDLEEWGVSPEKLTIVPYFVQAVPLSRRPRAELRAQRTLPLDRPVLLWMGRIHPEKSLPILFESLLDPRLLEAHLVLAGGSEDGALERELRQRASAGPMLGRIHFVGWVDDHEKSELFKLADLFVLPSRKENFGLAAAEAVASGLPAVVTEGCAVGPLLGEGGLICGHDPGQLATAIHRALTQPGMLERLQRGATAAGEALNGPAMVRGLEALFGRIAGRSTTEPTPSMAQTQS